MKRLQQISEIIGIVIGSLFLLFLILRGDEIPKFVYNTYERQIDVPIEQLLDKSQSIIDLIEEKHQTAGFAMENPDASVSAQDLYSYTLQVMNDFSNGKKILKIYNVLLLYNPAFLFCLLPTVHITTGKRNGLQFISNGLTLYNQLKQRNSKYRITQAKCKTLPISYKKSARSM